jgi:hypothetical protein
VAAPLSVLPSALPAYPKTPATLARLQAFRAGLHACCTRRADALVDLADALLSAQGPVASLPQLSLEPAHRRGWGGTYAALACGRIDAERLRDLLVGCLPHADPLVFAVDVTTWPRCDAECSPERGLYYHPRATRPASQSSPAGRSSGSASSASRGTPGPPRWTPAGCTPWTTPTTPPPCRSARCLLACPLAGRCRGSCSTPATTPRSCPWTSPRRPWRCWCGCEPTAASTTTRHPRHWARRAGRAATAPSSPSPTRPPGRPRPPPSTPPTSSTALSPCTPGPGCTPSSTATPATAAVGPADRAWHDRPRAGGARSRPHAAAQGAVAVVGRPRGLAAGSRPGLARLHPSLRPGAHRPLRQADPGLDHPTAAAPRPGRPLDLAGAGRLHPTSAGPRTRRRPTPAMGAAPPDRQAVPYRVRRGFPRLLAALGSPAAAPKPSGRSPGRPKGSRPGPAARYPAIKKAPKKHPNRQPTAAKAA